MIHIAVQIQLLLRTDSTSHTTVRPPARPLKEARLEESVKRKSNMWTVEEIVGSSMQRQSHCRLIVASLPLPVYGINIPSRLSFIILSLLERTISRLSSREEWDYCMSTSIICLSYTNLVCLWVQVKWREQGQLPNSANPLSKKKTNALTSLMMLCSCGHSDLVYLLIALHTLTSWTKILAKVVHENVFLC